MKTLKKFVTCFLLGCFITGCTNIKETDKPLDFDELYRNPTQYNISQHVTEEKLIFEFKSPLEIQLNEKNYEFDNNCKVVATFQKDKEKEYYYSLTLNYVGDSSSDSLKVFSPVYYDEEKNASSENHSITITFISENGEYSTKIPWNVYDRFVTGPQFTYNFVINEQVLNNSMNMNDVQSIVFEVDTIYFQEYSRQS